MSSVAVVARMRGAMFRRAVRDSAGPAIAAVLGLAGAGWMLWYAWFGAGRAGTVSLLVGLWVLSWITLPLLLGGVRGRVRPAHLRLEAMPVPVMSLSLLVASALGVGPAVSAVALLAIPAHAFSEGSAAVLVALAGAVLMWLLGLVGSAVALELVGRAGGPGGSVLTGILTGTVVGGLGSAWAVAPWIGRLLADGPPASLDVVLRWLPPDSLPGLLVLLAVVAALAVAHIALVRRTLAGAVRSGRSRTLRVRIGRGAVGAVATRELITWVRHPLRLQYLAWSWPACRCWPASTSWSCGPAR
jgi:ABC-2 type transport system permease protein